jgi:hypothetical protein
MFVFASCGADGSIFSALALSLSDTDLERRPGLASDSELKLMGCTTINSRCSSNDASLHTAVGLARCLDTNSVLIISRPRKSNFEL